MVIPAVGEGQALGEAVDVREQEGIRSKIFGRIIINLWEYMIRELIGECDDRISELEH